MSQKEPSSAGEEIAALIVALADKRSRRGEGTGIEVLDESGGLAVIVGIGSVSWNGHAFVVTPNYGPKHARGEKAQV